MNELEMQYRSMVEEIRKAAKKEMREEVIERVCKIIEDAGDEWYSRQWALMEIRKMKI